MNEPGAPAVRTGTTLCGKWTLERLLGEGGMASVYVARHKIGRLEAIKIMHPIIASSPELRARFEQEARIANRFKHPGAVDIRDIDVSEDGAPFLVMELLDGETLSAIARRSKEPLAVADVLRAADEVLDVLSAAHASGIIHRDIKPDNLLLTREGHVKVLDFGIARLREGLSRDVKTHTGTTLGTVAYMAPEQAKGGPIDARADLWAVGATMFRLLTGRRVHEAETEAERLAKLVSGPAPSLASVAAHVPAAVCAVVDRALAFDRANRYPDAAAMQADVRAAARGEAPASRPLPPSEARTRAEGMAVIDDAATRADRNEHDATTVRNEGTGGGGEVLRTEPMAPLRVDPTVDSSAPRSVPAPVSAPVPAPVSAPVPVPVPTSVPAPAPAARASLFAPANRVLLLVLAGACVLVVLIVVAAVMVGLNERSGPNPAGSAVPGETAAPAEPSAAAASPPAPASTGPEATALHPPPRVAPPPPPAGPKIKPRGR